MKKTNRPLFGKVPNWLLCTFSIVGLLTAWGTYSALHRSNAAVAPVVPEGVELIDLRETPGKVDGALRNGPQRLALAEFFICYVGADGEVASMVCIRADHLQPFECRDFSCVIPDSAGGLTRQIIPSRFRVD